MPGELTPTMVLSVVSLCRAIAHVCLLKDVLKSSDITPCLDSIFCGHPWNAEIVRLPLVHQVVVKMNLQLKGKKSPSKTYRRRPTLVVPLRMEQNGMIIAQICTQINSVISNTPTHTQNRHLKHD